MEIIISHLNADFDALASMIAIRKLYPGATMVFPGSQERNLREFFIQSTVYAFAFERLKNIDMEKVERLIIVDTRQKGRIGPFARLLEYKNIDIHIYDHHPASPDDIRGSKEVIRETGANITNICEILQEKNIEITPDEATIFMLGIYEDTGSLTFSSTTTRDFHAAAYLLSQGANLNTVSNMITREMTVEQVSLLNELIKELQTYEIHGLDIAITSASVDSYIPDLAFLLHKLIEMKTLQVAIALVRMEDRIYLVLRSRTPKLNVAEVALEFNGGGHPTAASATIKDMTLVQARETLLEVLNQKIRASARVMDVMSSPVKKVSIQTTIKKAAETLTKYNINAMPVIKGKRVVGLITRKTIQKAIYHGLDGLPVGEYMITDFITLSPDMVFDDIQRLIVENKQDFLPVTIGRKIVGCVTRTDLLNYLYEQHRELPESPPEAISVSPNIRKMAHVMKEKLPAHVYDLLMELGQEADGMNISAYAVGGFVRDMLLGFPNYDIDIVVEGDGIAYTTKFARQHKYRYKTHKTFGTAQLILPDNIKIDVATARTEYYKRPAAMPTVEQSSIKRDLTRRDFTVNTLALCINNDRFGQLLDYFGALKDIKDRRIRVLHSLSFVEDPTRILRALRFEHRFNFNLGKHTQKLIRNAINLDLFPRVEGSRILSELKLIMGEQAPGEIFKKMDKFGILHGIYPHLNFGNEHERIFNKLDKVISWYNLLYQDEQIKPWLAYFLALTDKLTPQGMSELCVRLGMKDKSSEFFLKGKKQAPRIIRKLETSRKMANSSIYQILYDTPLELLLFIMAKSTSEKVSRSISTYVTHLRNVEPLIKGRDLKQLGLAPGPIYREILSELRNARMNGEVTSREDEIQYVKSIL